ncbi:hypothetical protein [Microbacterium sp. SS28]|uniref:hypothetical protein n=1 Tax=Microbacterium sp. SS28 TaxID=2919948 RepID=UPI001FAA0144|nr:hypothetical protein [Microbacterium sp. SS28]
MLPRLASAALAVVLAAGIAAGMVTGCSPEPAPEDSPAFATEEEAFAAAEETYRAYVDALNQVDLSDPETFEDVYAWTTGDLNASDRKGLSKYHADGSTVTGSSEIALIEPGEIDHQTLNIQMSVCLDVSAVDVRDASGASLVSPDRTAVQSLTVTAVEGAQSPTGLLISSIGPREGQPTCSI